MTHAIVWARREGPQAVAKSVMGEFVSGNYFRTLGLQPAAGRLFTDADDAKGAAFTAVMSYDTWAHDYSSDPSVVGSTFRINTQPELDSPRKLCGLIPTPQHQTCRPLCGWDELRRIRRP